MADTQNSGVSTGKLDGTTETPTMRHKIGCTRTIQTAVLVVEYLGDHCAWAELIHRDAIEYSFTDPTPRNGFWSADIIVTTSSEYDKRREDLLTKMVECCRAFVAGRGEIW